MRCSLLPFHLRVCSEVPGAEEDGNQGPVMTVTLTPPGGI